MGNTYELVYCRKRGCVVAFIINENDHPANSFYALEGVKHLFAYLRIPSDSAHTEDTPARIVRAWDEFFRVGKEEFKFTVFNAESHDMVVEKDIHFYSVCAHHMLPFFGTACIAYIPDKKMAGLSKLVRTVNFFSHRMQVQEELTSQIADYLIENLETEDVAVVLKCEHLCLSMRGAKSPGHNTITAAMRGAFMEDAATRAEFYTLGSF